MRVVTAGLSNSWTFESGNVPIHCSLNTISERSELGNVCVFIYSRIKKAKVEGKKSHATATMSRKSDRLLK
jgi:hypothetical protein